MPVQNILDLFDPNNRFDTVNFENIYAALVANMAEVINPVTGTIKTTDPETIILNENDERKTAIFKNTGATDYKVVFTTQNGVKKYFTCPAYGTLVFEPIQVGSVHRLSDDKLSIIEAYIIKCECMSQMSIVNQGAADTTYEVLEIS